MTLEGKELEKCFRCGAMPPKDGHGWGTWAIGERKHGEGYPVPNLELVSCSDWEFYSFCGHCHQQVLYGFDKAIRDLRDYLRGG